MLIASLLSGPATSPIPPIERQHPVPAQRRSLRMETFQLNIDQQRIDCSAGEVSTGDKFSDVLRSPSIFLKGSCKFMQHAAEQDSELMIKVVRQAQEAVFCSFF